MTTEDKLYNKIKKAAENAPEKDFAGFEKVWNRVDEKLDTVVVKKSNYLWKVGTIAASFLLVTSFAYQLYQNNNEDNSKINTTNSVVETSNSENEVLNEETTIIPQDKIDAVIENQLNKTPVVATESVSNTNLPDEIQVMSNNEMVIYKKEKALFKDADAKGNTTKQDLAIEADKAMAPNTIQSNAYNSVSSYSNPSTKRDKNFSMEQAETVESKQKSQKNDDLILIDDKVASKNELLEMNTKEVDSITVLPNPLYIIDGVDYSEESLFGKNPTSPYAPLGKQKIEKTIVYKPKEALEKFGSKGKNGVVIITTKNGKPAKR
jgi:hypothetical protein